jgi:hypothetical protein
VNMIRRMSSMHFERADSWRSVALASSLRAPLPHSTHHEPFRPIPLSSRAPSFGARDLLLTEQEVCRISELCRTTGENRSLAPTAGARDDNEARKDDLHRGTSPYNCHRWAKR